MMKITGLSHLFKWENFHNWWLTKYFFAPLYIYKKSFKFRPNFVPNSMKVVKMKVRTERTKDTTGKVENQLIILHSERLIISPKHLFVFHLKGKIIISSNKSNTFSMCSLLHEDRLQCSMGDL